MLLHTPGHLLKAFQILSRIIVSSLGSVCASIDVQDTRMVASGFFKIQERAIFVGLQVIVEFKVMGMQIHAHAWLPFWVTLNLEKSSP